MKNRLTLVDAHVHLHPFVDYAAVFDAAAQNFRQAAHARHAASWEGMLLLAEISGVDAFSLLCKRALAGPVGAWNLRVSDAESTSLTAERNGERIIMVAGRQAATQEGLEVLALATRSPLQDRQDLASTLSAASGVSSLVVLPWAVGKWLGRRGRLIKQAIAAEPRVFLGDNGGRPWFWAPAIFRGRGKRERPILPGSDPLPIPGEELRVGSRGFLLQGVLPSASPATALCERLAAAAGEDILPYGRPEQAWRFVRNQIRLRRPSHE